VMDPSAWRAVLILQYDLLSVACFACRLPMSRKVPESDALRANWVVLGSNPTLSANKCHLCKHLR
jgi:hypothetical protein